MTDQFNSILFRMQEAKDTYFHLRKQYLKKIEEVKKGYNWYLNEKPTKTDLSIKKEIVLGLVYDMSIGWGKFDMHSHRSDSGVRYFYNKNLFNPAVVLSLKTEKNILLQLLNINDWRKCVENRDTKLGYHEWIENMKGDSEIPSIIDILIRRENLETGIFEVPELFRKEQFLVLVYPVKNEKYGYL